jgi:hypothetical protein
MVITMTHKRKAIRIAALLAALMVIAGCAGIQPYNPPNHREEGPAKGLFTGSQGEWVIVGPKEPQAGSEENKTGVPESETDRQQKKNPETSADDEQ